jgi:hypothetical protein|nr:MAG TPA: ASCH domain protein [Caudoviricetes sp.]
MVAPAGIPGMFCREKDFYLEYSHYKVGEVVAVAQSYKDCTEECIKTTGLEVTTKPHLAKVPGYKNKMFVKAEYMPHHIRITGVRIERLQDISDEDCIREGIIAKWHAPGARNLYYIPNKQVRSEDDIYLTPHEAYAAMIDRICGKGTWRSNPYVFVYDFELVD